MDADYSAGFLVDLQHYRGGPTFKVMCNDIIAAGEDDLRLCAKTTDGWRFTRTCPTIVLRAGNMEEYMLKNIEQCLRAAEGTWMHSLLCKVDRNDPLVTKALLLWTATHLLMSSVANSQAQTWHFPIKFDILSSQVVNSSSRPSFNQASLRTVKPSST